MAAFKFNFLADDDHEYEAPVTENTIPTRVPDVSSLIVYPDLSNPIYCSVLSASLPRTIANCPLVKYLSLEDITNLMHDGTYDHGDLSKLISITESCNTDLVPGLYEGGFKIWECTFDLLQYFQTSKIDFSDRRILDLGCGAGLLGAYALINNAKSVHFQDFNPEVLSYLTTPNLLINLVANKLPNIDDVNQTIKSRCGFFSGDWSEFESLIEQSHTSHLYDIILTSETIYSMESQNKLLQIFERFLSPNGIILVGAKSHYFGVGGNTLLFSQLVTESKLFEYEIVHETQSGLPRQIIKLTRPHTNSN